MAKSRRQLALDKHLVSLVQCRRCRRVVPPPVCGGPILSKVMIIGQAPGVREPVLARPFAHTAGRTLFRWFEEFCGMNEAAVRATVYFGAVIRCFPGKAPGGGDRVPSPVEISNCASWRNDEFEILQPALVIPVGRLAIAQFIAFEKLDEVIGRTFRLIKAHGTADLIPLPHPSGASPWHKLPPGKQLLAKALGKISRHPEIRALKL
jgi:uracil-DNA glycosylase